MPRQLVFLLHCHIIMWCKMAPIPTALVSHAKPSGMFGSKCASTSVEVRASLILLKLSSHSVDQQNWTSFLSNLFRGALRSARKEINLL